MPQIPNNNNNNIIIPESSSNVILPNSAPKPNHYRYLDAVATDKHKQELANKMLEKMDKIKDRISANNPEQEAELLEVLDGDTIKVRFNTGEEAYVRDSTLSGYYFDSPDSKESVDGSPFKQRLQPKFVAKMVNKPVTELTPQDYENVKNYATQMKTFYLTEGMYGNEPETDRFKTAFGHFKGTLTDDEGNPITELSSYDTDENGNEFHYPLVTPNQNAEDIKAYTRIMNKDRNTLTPEETELQNRVLSKAREYSYNNRTNPFYNENPRQAYNPNHVYNPDETSVAGKGVKVNLHITGRDEYGRVLASVKNAYTDKLVTEELSSRLDQNTAFSLEQMNARNEKFLQYTNLTYDKDLSPKITIGEYLTNLPNVFVRSIDEYVVGAYQGLERFGGVGKAGRAILSAVSAANVKYNEFLNYIGIADADSVSNYTLDEVSRMSPEDRAEYLNILNGVDKSYVNYQAHIQNEISEAYDDGRYIDMVINALIATPDVITTSLPAVLVGGVAGKAVGTAAGIGVKAISTSSKVAKVSSVVAGGITASVGMSLGQLGEGLDTYERQNGHEMPNDKAMLYLAGLAITNSLDVAMLKTGADALITKTMKKGLSKAVTDIADPTKKEIAKKIVGKYFVAGTAGTAGEAIQEGIQTTFDTYMTQRQADGQTLLEIATGKDTHIAMLLGGAAGGTVATSAKLVGDTGSVLKGTGRVVTKGVEATATGIGKVGTYLENRRANKEQPQSTVSPEEHVAASTYYADIDTLSQELNRDDITLDELNDVVKKGKSIRENVLKDNNIVSDDVLHEMEKLGAKTLLRKSMLLNDDSLAENVLNNKEFNPTGIKDKETLLRKLYYFSDKNNQQEQDVIEKIATQLKVDPSKFKNYEQVEEEAVFGKQGYITYGNILRSYNEKLSNKNLTEQEREVLTAKKERIEQNLEYFANSQVKKLNRISNGITELKNNNNLVKEVKISQPVSNSNVNEEYTIHRNNVIHSKGNEGVWLVIDRTKSNIEGIIHELKTNNSSIDTDSIIQTANKELQSIIKNANALRDKANQRKLISINDNTKVQKTNETDKKQKPDNTKVKANEEQKPNSTDKIKESNEAKIDYIKTHTKDELENILVNAFNETNPTTTVEKSQVRNKFNNNISNPTNTVLSHSVGNLLDYMNKVLVSMPAVLKLTPKVKKKLFYNLDDKQDRKYLQQSMQELIDKFKQAKSDEEIKALLKDKKFEDVYYTLLKYTKNRFSYYSDENNEPRKSYRRYYMTVYDTVNKTLKDLHTLASNIEPNSSVFKSVLEIKTVSDKFKKYLKTIANKPTVKPVTRDKVESNTNIPKGEKVAVEPKSEASKPIVAKKEETKPQYINHSGGAKGADSVWGNVGKLFGVQSNHYYYKSKTPAGNVSITEEQYQEGLVEYKKAAKALKRNTTNNPYVLGLVSRNWQQIKPLDKERDAVFAIGTLDKTTSTVNGGTGYAVEMAKNKGVKNIYVFNQQAGIEQWTKWDYSKQKFIPINYTPKLTPNFAGIGTRDITPAGIQAIKNVYKNTFNKPEIKETNKTDNTKPVVTDTKPITTKITNTKPVITSTTNAKPVIAAAENIKTVTTSIKALGTKDSPVKIFSDGSDIKGTGNIGYGSVFTYKDKDYYISGTNESNSVLSLQKQFPDAKFSNPTMELLAVMETLKLFAENKIGEHIDISQDYKGLVNYSQIKKYVAEDSGQVDKYEWKTKEPYIKYIVDNIGKYAEEIIANGGSVTFRHVKGHQKGSSFEAVMNNKADMYAKSRDTVNTMLDAYKTETITKPKEETTIPDKTEKKPVSGGLNIKGNYWTNIGKEYGFKQSPIEKADMIVAINTTKELNDVLKKINTKFNKIPMYVYQQERDKWYRNISGKWEKSDIPVLKGNVSGYVTQGDITDESIQAINDVFERYVIDELDFNTYNETEIKDEEIPTGISVDEIKQQYAANRVEEVQTPEDYSPEQDGIQAGKDNIETEKIIPEGQIESFVELIKDIPEDELNKILRYTDTEILKHNLALVRTKVEDKVTLLEEYGETADNLDNLLAYVNLFAPSKSIIGELTPIVSINAVAKDEKGELKRSSSGYYEINPDKVVEIPFVPFREKVFKDDKGKRVEGINSLIRSKKAQLDFIANKTTAFSVFKDLDKIENISKVVDENTLLKIQRNESLDDLKQDKNSLTKEKQTTIKEQNELYDKLNTVNNKKKEISEFYTKLNDRLGRYAQPKKKAKVKYKDKFDEFVKELTTQEKALLEEHGIKTYDLMVSSLAEFKEVIRPIQASLVKYKEESNDIFNDFIAIQAVTTDIKNELNQITVDLKYDTVMSTTRAREEYQARIEDTDFTGVTKVLKKFTINENKQGSLFTMVDVNPDDAYVKETLAAFKDSTMLNLSPAKINQLLENNVTPALALVYNSKLKDLPVTNKERMKASELKEVIDLNTIMALDHAVNTLFSINRKIFTISDQTLKASKGNKFIYEVLQTYKLPTRNLIVDKLGEYTMQSLGISPNKDIATYMDVEAMKQSLGLLAFNYATQKGYIREKSIARFKKDGKTIRSTILIAEDITNQADRDLMKTKYDTLSLEMFHDKSGMYTTPPTTEPLAIKDSVARQKPTKLMEIAHERLRETPFKADYNVIDFVINNEELVKHYLGYVPEEELDKIPLYDIRIEQEGKNQTIDYSIQQIKDFYDKNWDRNQPFYFDTFASKNYRNMLASNTINPQSDKLHRFMMYPEDANFLRDLDLSNDKDKVLFTYGLAQAFGLDVDSTPDAVKLEYYDKITKLDPEEINQKLLAKEELKFKDITLEVENISHFIQGINALRIFKKQQKLNPDKIIIPKETPLLVETDSASSGICLKAMSLAFFDDDNIRDIAAKTGVFINEAKTINKEKYDPDTTDVYQWSAVKMPDIRDGIDPYYMQLITEFAEMSGIDTGNLPFNKEEVFNMFKDILPAVGEDKKVSKELRKLFKSPTMTNMYQVGFKSMTESLSSEIMISMFTEYSKNKSKGITNENTEAVENFFKYIIPSIKHIKDVPYKLIKAIKKQVETGNPKLEQQAVSIFLEILKTKTFQDIKLDNTDMLSYFRDTVGFVYGGLVWVVLAENYGVLRGSTVMLGYVNAIYEQALKDKIPLAKLNTVPINEITNTLAEGKEGDLKAYFGIPAPYSTDQQQSIVSIDMQSVSGLKTSDWKLSEEKKLPKENISIVTPKTSANFYTETQKDSPYKDINISSTVLHGKEFKLSTNSLAAMTTHGIDSASINTVHASIGGILGVHDAEVRPVTHRNDISRHYNKAVYDVSMNYNVYREAYNVLNSIRREFDGKKHPYIAVSHSDMYFIVKLFQSPSMAAIFENYEPDKNNLVKDTYKLITSIDVSNMPHIDKTASTLPLIYQQNIKDIKIQINTYINLLGMLAHATEVYKERAKGLDLYVSNMDGTDESYYSNQNNYNTNTNTFTANNNDSNSNNNSDNQRDDNDNNTVNTNSTTTSDSQIFQEVEQAIQNVFDETDTKTDDDTNNKILKYMFDTTPDEDAANISSRLLKNGEERILLFDDLIKDTPFNDSEFSNELRDTLKSLSSLRLDNLTVDIINRIGKHGEYDLDKHKITLDSSPEAPYSRYSNAGVRYAHEIVHAATAVALENHATLGLSTDLQKLYHLYRVASKHLTPDDFMPEVIVDEELDRKEAKNIYNYIFLNKDKDFNLRGLNEFIAYALTDERVVNKLKSIPVEKNKDITKSLGSVLKEIMRNIFKLFIPAKNKTLENIFPKFYNTMIGNTDFKTNDVYSSLFNLVERVVKADNKALANQKSLARSVKTLLHGVSDVTIAPLNKGIGTLLKSLTTLTDKQFDLNKIIAEYDKEDSSNSNLMLVKVTGRVLKHILTSSKARNALPTVLSYYGRYTTGEVFSGYGLAGRWINEIKTPDGYTRAITEFSSRARIIDKSTKEIMDTIHKLSIENFKDELRPNGLNEVEKALLNKVILKTDVQSLDISSTELKKLLNSPKLLEENIQKQLDEIKNYSKSDKEYFFFINSSKLLARYLITGDMSSITALNAEDIANKSGTDLSKTTAPKELVDAINKYSTLLALKFLPDEQKSIVSTFSNKGLDFFIDTHKNYVKNSNKEISKDTYAGRSKGYTEVLFDNSHDIRIGFEEQQDLFKTKGFKPIPDSTVGSLGDKKLILYKDGFKEKTSRNGSAFMYTGYMKLGTTLYTFLDTEKEILNKTDESVRQKAILYRGDIERNRRQKVRKLYEKELTYNELQQLTKNYSNTFTVFDEHGNPAEYGLSIPAKLRKELGNSDDGIAILAKMQSTLVRQQLSTSLNKDLFLTLAAWSEQKQNSGIVDSKDNHRWVSISDASGSKFLQKAFQMTDEQFKKLTAQYKNETGNDLLIREDLVLDVIGQVDVNLATKITRDNPTLRYVLDFAERLLKFIATQYKGLIVIKTPAVLIGNIVSNVVMGMLGGYTPIAVLKSYMDDLRQLQNYTKTKQERDALLIKKTLQSLTEAEERDLVILDQKLKNNPLHELIELGFLQNIVEDVDLVQIDNTNYFDTKLQKLKDRLPSPLQTVLDIAFMTEKTTAYQVMTKATTYSDFLARSFEYKMGLQKLKKQNLSKEEFELAKYNMKHRIMENYVNYDKPHSAGEQWLNDMGFVLFTKYLKRIQSVIYRFATEKPVDIGLFLALNAATVDASNIFTSSLLVKDLSTYVYNPINSIPELLTPPILRH